MCALVSPTYIELVMYKVELENDSSSSMRGRLKTVLTSYLEDKRAANRKAKHVCLSPYNGDYSPSSPVSFIPVPCFVPAADMFGVPPVPFM